VTKQLNKLIDIIKVVEVTPLESVDRELALIKVAAKAKDRAEVIQIADIFRAKIIDVSTESVVIEITGSGDKIDALEELMRPFGIKEMVRTGKVALVRGSKLTQYGK
jgi:acetolactate synthase-1/3 small subunit